MDGVQIYKNNLIKKRVTKLIATLSHMIRKCRLKHQQKLLHTLLEARKVLFSPFL